MKKRQVVVITGVSAGAGRAIANEFVQEVAKLLLMARGIARLESA